MEDFLASWASRENLIHYTTEAGLQLWIPGTWTYETEADGTVVFFRSIGEVGALRIGTLDFEPRRRIFKKRSTGESEVQAGVRDALEHFRTSFPYLRPINLLGKTGLYGTTSDEEGMHHDWYFSSTSRIVMANYSVSKERVGLPSVVEEIETARRIMTSLVVGP